MEGGGCGIAGGEVMICFFLPEHGVKLCMEIQTVLFTPLIYFLSSLPPQSSEELKELPFFRYTNWESVMEGKLIPPLVPPRGEVRSHTQISILQLSPSSHTAINHTAITPCSSGECS